MQYFTPAVSASLESSTDAGENVYQASVNCNGTEGTLFECLNKTIQEIGSGNGNNSDSASEESPFTTAGVKCDG